MGQGPQFWQLANVYNSNVKPAEVLYHHDQHLRTSLNPVKYAMQSAMYFYQQKITYQLPSTCLYSPSCSEFSRQCFETFNPVKALFLSIDRLQRCNRFEMVGKSQYDMISGESTVKYKDEPCKYQFHSHK